MGKKRNSGNNNKSSKSQQDKPNGQSARGASAPRAQIQRNPTALVIKHKNSIRLQPCDKAKSRFTYEIHPSELRGAKPGDIVAIEAVPTSNKGQWYKVTGILGHKDDPGIESKITIHEYGLRTEFSKAAMDEVANLTVPALNGREDLRGIDLVTIDPEGARDHDDAVFAEPTKDGGHHIIVAIADVAAYVKPGGAIDQEAYLRGNSTYLPDRVIPMLPERLSNDLCSLKDNEDRACLAWHLWINKDGELQNYKVVRGLMQSKASLTYEQVQMARDGQPDAVTTPLMNKVINPLYDAYEALAKAREARGTLTFESPERKILTDKDENVTRIETYDRGDSHKLVEEFMILTNVASDLMGASIKRVHEAPPSEQKISQLKEMLEDAGIKPGTLETAADFTRVLQQAKGKPEYDMIAQTVLRAQAKACYSTRNVGHFGLALSKYAHSTSPIRRDSDLVVHRNLIALHQLGNDGVMPDKAKSEIVAEHLSETEIRSSRAERDAKDRLTAKFLVASIGNTFTGEIRSINNVGIFVSLDGTGASGLIPMKSLSKAANEYFHLNEDKQILRGNKSGTTYYPSMKISVTLKEANPLSGRIVFEPANDNSRPNLQKKPAPGPGL